MSGCLLVSVLLSSISAVRLHWEPNEIDIEDLDEQLVFRPEPSKVIIKEGDDVVKNSQFEGETVDVVDILAYSSDTVDQFQPYNLGDEPVKLEQIHE